jgi:cold shock CspA family protein
VAIRDAVDAARRRLEGYARRQRGAVKAHEGLPRGRVSKLFPEEGYGFLDTPDGREIYCHRHSVLHPGFDRLDIGMEVRFFPRQLSCLSSAAGATEPRLVSCKWTVHSALSGLLLGNRWGEGSR